MSEFKEKRDSNSVLVPGPQNLDFSTKLAIVDEWIRSDYLNRIGDMSVLTPEFDQTLTDDLVDRIRLFKITEISYQKNESIEEKLSTVYSALTLYPATLFLLINSNGSRTDFYIGVRVNPSMEARRSAVSVGEVLKQGLIGNFPGIQVLRQDRRELQKLTDVIERSKNVVSVSVKPDRKADQSHSAEQFTQGMEKLANAMGTRSYTALIIAENQSPETIQKYYQDYLDLYTRLIPYQKIQISESSTKGTSRNKSFSEMNGKQRTAVVGSALSSIAGVLIGNTAAAASAGIGAIVGSQIGAQVGNLISALIPAEQMQESSSYSESRNYENKMITELLGVLDERIREFRNFNSYGMWNTAAYFLSDDMPTAEIAASSFRSLMTGEKTGLHSSALSSWRTGPTHPESLGVIQSLSRFVHPVFNYGSSQNAIRLEQNAGIPVSGKDLGLFLGLPRQTIAGLPVIEHAQFGREVISSSIKMPNRKQLTRSIHLGRIYHLGQTSKTDVDLSTDSLSMHTFVTGSTGSGKSNTVYQMLEELYQDGIQFLVIEPAKGEYKNVFGHYEDVNVFSTNPKDAELIHLNPFRFPESVHILEHIDGLIEIFSACWPMYDAMPAFFKSAVLSAYESVGWDLASSLFEGPEIRWPDFNILADQLDRKITDSDYSEEIKSNYRGALLTRVRSLSTGLNRLIFSNEQTPMERLFDENCILDLSKAKSTETKALLMGIMVYTMNEYRQDQSRESNVKLHHITVLEEAHNLLKNSGPNASSLESKSIEMITQTIAEIRTYGEGFLIVDQSPSAVDSSVIKNTNTKIVLRTPEFNDRQAIGKSIGLDEEQIDEIAKLPSGVAAVYQNDWISPVLVHVEKADVEEIRYIPEKSTRTVPIRKARTYVIGMLLSVWGIPSTNNIDLLKDSISVLNIDNSTRALLNELLEDYEIGQGRLYWTEEKGQVLYQVVPAAAEITQSDLKNLKTADDFEQLISSRLWNSDKKMNQLVMQFSSKI